MRACGTVRWDLVLSRSGPLRFDRAGDGAPDAAANGARGGPAPAGASLPEARLTLAVAGTAGVDGRVARALGLDDVAVDALADVRVGLDATIGADWCPRVRVRATHRWRRPPTLGWKAGLDVDVSDAADAAIGRELAALGPRLDAAIDCAALRRTLARHWHAHEIPLELPEIGAARLALEPTGFGFSGLVRDGDSIGLAFALEARTSLEAIGPDGTADGADRSDGLSDGSDGDASGDGPSVLPPLREVAFAPGRTDIALPARLGWARLQRAASEALVGRELAAGTPLGDVRLVPTSVSLGGVRGGGVALGAARGAAVGVTVGFEAALPGRRRPVRGRLHLAATPVVDARANELRLDDVRVSPVLDGALWSRLGPLVESRLVDALRERGRADLAPWLDALEARLVAQLADPSRTAGLAVRASDVELGVGRVAAGRDGLALELRASADVDVDVPAATLAAALERR